MPPRARDARGRFIQYDAASLRRAIVNAHHDRPGLRGIVTADLTSAYLRGAAPVYATAPHNIQELIVHEIADLEREGLLVSPSLPKTPPPAPPPVPSSIWLSDRPPSPPPAKARLVATGSSITAGQLELARRSAEGVQLSRWKRVLRNLERDLKLRHVRAAIRLAIRQPRTVAVADASTQTEDNFVPRPPTEEELDELRRCWNGWLRAANRSVSVSRAIFRGAITAGRTYSEASGFVQLVGIIVPAIAFLFGASQTQAPEQYRLE